MVLILDLLRMPNSILNLENPPAANPLLTGGQTGSEAASPEINLDGLQSAAQQLETTVSRFAQEAENSQESLVTALQQVSEQSAAGVQKVRSELCANVERLESWIRNNRR